MIVADGADVTLVSSQNAERLVNVLVVDRWLLIARQRPNVQTVVSRSSSNNQFVLFSHKTGAVSPIAIAIAVTWWIQLDLPACSTSSAHLLPCWNIVNDWQLIGLDTQQTRSSPVKSRVECVTETSRECVHRSFKKRKDINYWENDWKLIFKYRKKFWRISKMVVPEELAEAISSFESTGENATDP